jgi:hypothetical protein
MKETLIRIKRGEQQLFLGILESYLSLVYLSARRTLSENDSIEVTFKIFTNLYKKIQKFKFWNNADTFILKNLDYFASKNGFTLYQDYLGKNEDVPQVIMRKILIHLSAKETSKKRKSIIIAVPTFIAIAAFAITFVINVSSNENFYPVGTITKASTSPTSLFSKSYVAYNGTQNVIQFVNMDVIDDEHLIIEALDDNADKYFEIYSHNEKISEIMLNLGARFLTAGANNSLVFYDHDDLYLYDFNGNNVKILRLNENPIFSDNYYFVANKENDIYKLYRLADFSLIDECMDEVLFVSDTGRTITVDMLESYGYDFYLNNDSYRVAQFIENDFITIDESGILTIYSYGEKHISSQLQYFSYMKEMDLYNGYISHSFSINYNDNYIIIAIEGDEYSGFEIINRENGKPVADIRDTILYGKHNPPPQLSADGNILLVANQIWNNRKQYRYNAAYDLTKLPIEAIPLDRSKHIRQMQINGHDNTYYVYTINTQGILRIHQIKTH